MLTCKVLSNSYPIIVRCVWHAVDQDQSDRFSEAIEVTVALPVCVGRVFQTDAR